MQSLQYVRKDDHRPLAPSSFLCTLWRNESGALAELAGYSQQDVHELYIYLLNRMHQSVSSSATHPAGSIQTAKCSCFIHQVFSGSLSSITTCTSCQQISRTEDSFFDLSLAIPSGTSSVSLVDCLTSFLSPEFMDGPNQSYQCSNCQNSYTSSLKQLCINDFPQTLCLHLKVQHGEPYPTIAKATRAHAHVFPCLMQFV